MELNYNCCRVVHTLITDTSITL